MLITFVPLACIMSAALGLMFGTLFDPRTVPLLFGIVVIPLTFLGCIYFPWAPLESIRWLQILVLVNPLVYMSEGFRAALTPVPHMALWAVYPVLIGFTAAVRLGRPPHLQAARAQLTGHAARGCRVSYLPSTARRKAPATQSDRPGSPRPLPRPNPDSGRRRRSIDRHR